MYHEKRVMRSVCAFTLLFALLMTSNGVSNVASAAAKKKAKAPKLSVKTVKLTAGKKKTVKLKNKPKKATVKWSSKNKKLQPLVRKVRLQLRKQAKQR